MDHNYSKLPRKIIRHTFDDLLKVLATFAAKNREITCRVSVAFTVLPEACQSRQIGDILKTHIQLKLNFQQNRYFEISKITIFDSQIAIFSILK